MAKVYGTKSTEEALKHLLRSRDSNPNDPFIYHAIGLQFYAVRCYKDALKFFYKAEEIKAGISSSNSFYLAECLRKTGNAEQSIEYYKKALSIPAFNKVDRKGLDESRKYLLSHGFTESELNALSTVRCK
ncbi:hypothetical protein M3Y97_00211800 [Aphelenchoides bicaudatus]|nr:hypothetical protein M3Y97_00211800 [Aphelenchoides bicaudatus]